MSRAGTAVALGIGQRREPMLNETQIRERERTMIHYGNDTWIEPEEYTYPSGGLKRRAKAILRENPHNPITLPYGVARIVRASIADTFFSVPARWRGVKGFLSVEDDILVFKPEANPEKCRICTQSDGCRYEPS